MLNVSCQITAAEDNRITVVTEEWPPYSYIEEGVVKGISTEIVKASLEQAGLNYTLDVYPWARSYKKALAEKNTLIYAIVKTDERLPLFKWVRPVAPAINTYFYKLRSRDDVILTSLEDAKEYVVGTNRESDHHQFLLKNNFPEIEDSNHSEHSLRMLMLSRVDLVIYGSENIDIEIKKIGESMDKVEKVLLVNTQFPYMAFSRDSPDDIVIKLTNAYDFLLKSGKIQNLIESTQQEY